MTPTNIVLASPFHAGEQAIQARLGVQERMAEVGRRVIRDHLPDQHRDFFAQLPFMLVGSVDAAQRPWASVLVGAPGFMTSPDPHRLDIAARPIPGDPLEQGLQVGAPLGFLGIELPTRRRNRMNGRVVSQGATGLSIAVEQTVGNCPQYIQGRSHERVRDWQDQRPRRQDRFSALDAQARAQIAQADTLFVATHAPAEAGAGARGADVSHRGGRTGFVKIEDERTLLVPDFTGNYLFMSLGNMALNPRAGLLFIDFERGDLLMLTGRTEIVWEGEELAAFEGADRAWRFHLDEGIRLGDALPLRWAAPDFSPNSLMTGTWAEAASRRETARLAASWRPYRVTRVMDESSVIRSFYLLPADGHALPTFDAGQYLPIRLRLPGAASDIRRTYTLSGAPSDPWLRLSIKREGARPGWPVGVASNFLHDHLHEGDILHAMGPQGRFNINPRSQRPAVLIAAGVGITPMMAFLRQIVAEGIRKRRTRPVHFIQVARDHAMRAFGAELQALQERAGAAMKLHLVLDVPQPPPAAAAVTALQGPLDIDLLKRLLPFDDHEFYLCGPGGFMQALYDGLRGLGVRDERIHAEAFGPASLQRRPDAGVPAAVAPPAPAAEASVSFVRSAVHAAWTPASGSLLELAEGAGLSPPFGCRSGHCGSCVSRLHTGQVTYPQAPGWQCSEGEVLLCCALPRAGGGETLEIDI